ncbi:hypothetical protein Y032_0488g2353 [Ancylostoma ceylanicum]|uniref:Uncharacterized protein n=1 Tax=Ancylostoma ceylanicum TaxID=53326 RepID=A0A016WX71_9BILA|nr:hypothetical protein Y032_0488g2353 [Ancylostoma ceylanicum]
MLPLSLNHRDAVFVTARAQKRSEVFFCRLPNYRTKSPAYLTSETKKLIEEQEQGRGHRIASPSAQSSSFKRISQAVGEPVK